MKKTKNKWIFLKFFVTGILLLYLVDKVGLHSVHSYFEGLSVPVTILIGLLFSTQCVSSTLSWALCVKFCARRIDTYKLFKISAVAMAINQVIPAALGGILTKGIMLSKECVETDAVIASIFLERATNYMSLAIMGIISIFLLINFLSINSEILVVINISFISFFFSALVVFLFLKHIIDLLPKTVIFAKIRKFLSKIASFYINKKYFFASLGFGFWWNLVSPFVLLVLGWAFIENNEIIKFLLVATICIMVAAIPISIAGWGVREGAMVSLMPLAGLEQDQALALSIIFGGLLAVSRIPLLLLLIFPSKQKL